MWGWYLNIARAYITSQSRAYLASRDLLYLMSTLLSASARSTQYGGAPESEWPRLVYVPGAPSYELSDELDKDHVMIAVLLPVGGNRTHETVPQDILTTTALHHSDIEVLVEFDKYFNSRVVFRFKNVFDRKICRKLALRSRIFLQVPKLLTDLDQILLNILILKTYTKFIRKNKMSVCLPQPCSSTGRRFAASKSRLQYCRRIVSFP